MPSNPKDTIVIFQSLNNVQIMLPELGFVNALRAYLDMHGIKYVIDQRSNVEFMSPDGELPIIKHGPKIISGYKSCIEFINMIHNIESRAKQAAVNEILIQKVFQQAELYYTWLNKEIYENFTKQNYSYGRPWPLNHILCWMKQRDVASRLEDIDNMQNNFSEILTEIVRNIKAGISSDDLLCLIYGHIKAILSYEKPYEPLYFMVKEHQTLIEFVEKFDKTPH
ncbi:metaxin-2-like [Sarcoptes scabiei]|nr:hypothetical protein QR98_0084040 [Sarcoptes scabiei]UXI14193.1 metaxin-2-like [Sarcoptes scabiei]